MVQARRREGEPADPSETVSDVVVHMVPMRRRHLRSVLRIEAQVYPRPWSLGLFMSELALRNSRVYYVARIEGVVVGYGGLMVSGDDGHITTLAVDPAWHRRKLASRVLLALVREGVARGVSSLTLEVRVGNVGAQELYRQFGFAPAGIRKNYYVETNEDALVMWVARRRRGRLSPAAGGDRGRDPGAHPAPRRPVARRRPARRSGGRAAMTTGAGAEPVSTGQFRILGIETSCDETAAAIVVNGTDVVSSVVSSQVDLHARFGGVVPEIASRAHVELLTPVVARVLVESGLDGAQLDAVAATVGPGLAGALLVGVSTAKALALVWGVPFVGVNHMEAHLYACFLEDPTLEPPLLVLLVSGGHTMLVSMEDHGRYRLVGTTLDDAVGEAFDKVARFLGPRLPGGTGHRPPGPGGRPRRGAAAPPHARGLRLLPQRPEDGRHPLCEGPPRGGDAPTWPPPSSGRSSTCSSTRPGGRPGRRAPRPSASAAGWPPTPFCGRRSSTPARRTGCGRSSPAGRCAPTTRPWSPPPPGGGYRRRRSQPPRRGVNPNLRLV